MTKSGNRNPGKAKAGERRYGHARALSELLPDVGRAAFRRYGFVQSAIVSRWPEIVGERYARVSSPESIRFPRGERSEGVLALTVAGAHGTMMQHIAPEIIERVNRFFGYPAVARVQFRQGVVSRPRRPAPPSPTPTRPGELGEGLRAIADPELREVLGALAMSVEQPVVHIPKLGKIS
ncbi:DUF721 domain-containing protein [Stakelama sp. CBK3Z-3]|uniref:DUF721 domain-containing protein n=1 Tax=Stakelama flava TaxID=2860338 RepID=A0ABS6XJT9_9SPHN|nr:DUF721 domain-containing protein [Stakelama flava]MBW4330184.1 DUF721 domain-containing protein [Stakelama flava]